MACKMAKERKQEVQNRISQVYSNLNTDGKVLFIKIVEKAESNTSDYANFANWILMPNTLYTREICEWIKYEDELQHFNATCNIDDTVHKFGVWRRNLKEGN